MAADRKEPEMREEYDFTTDDVRRAVRGKYAEAYARGTNIVIIEPDVAEVFPNSDAVNRAPRALAGIIKDLDGAAARKS